MAVKLLFFAQCAEWMNAREMEISPPGGPVRLSDLIREAPELRPMRERLSLLKLAVNRQVVGGDAEVSDGDEVAFLPPVSGG